MLAEYLQDVGEQSDAGAEQNQPDHVEGMSAALTVVGQMEIHQNQAGEADGKVDEEDDSPVEVGDDKTAGDGPEHGADQAGDGDEGHRPDELRFGEGSHQGEASDGNHHGPAATLNNAAGDQSVNVGAEPAEH